MTDYFINSILEKEKKQERRNNLLFGYAFGISTLFLSVLFFLKDIPVYKVLLPISLVVDLLTIINPNMLRPIYKVMEKVFGFIGEIVLMILLTIIYIIFIIPVGFVMQRITKKKEKNITSTFTLKEDYKFDPNKKGNALIKLLSVFTKKEFIMFLPLIIILIIIGLILLFTTSTYISPFIYPLF